jgi:WD40 repeat protein
LKTLRGVLSQTLRAFEIASGREVARRATIGSSVSVVPGGRDVIYTGEDGRLHRLLLPGEPLDPVLAKNAGAVITASKSTTGLAVDYWDGAQVFDAGGGSVQLAAGDQGFNVLDADLSADGQYALLSLRESEWREDSPGDIVVQDTRTGMTVSSLHRGNHYGSARLAGRDVAVLSELRSSYVDETTYELLWWNWRSDMAKVLVSNNPVTDITVSPDGALFATTEGSSETPGSDVVGIQQVRVWNAATGEERITIPTGFAFARVAFSPRNRYLAIMGQAEGLLVDLKSGEIVLTVGAAVAGPTENRQHIVYETIPNRVNRLWPDFAAHDEVLVVVAETHLIVYDLKTGVTERLQESAPIKGAAFSRDGRYVALYSDGMARIWDLAEREFVASIPVTGLRGLSFAGPDASNLIAVADDSVVRLAWRPDELAHRACRIFADDDWQRSRFRATGATEDHICD